MIPIQPPLIPSFFSLKKTIVKKNFYSQFFLSWEDALWHLLNIHKIAEGSIILIPEFFCWDVVANMKSHGLISKTYKVDKYLQPDINDFCKQIKNYQPAIIIIFHAVGITNNLLQHNEKWLKFLPKNSLIIEDCVHRIIDSRKINFISENHYLIDSLRKVVPVQGSRLYSKNSLKSNSTIIFFLTRFYVAKVTFWWAIMQFFLVLNYYSNNKKINIFAEKSMQRGYDIIGDHKLPATGSLLMSWLSKKIDLSYIFHVKSKQAQFYSRSLASFFLNTNKFYQIPIKSEDFHNLRGYPLGISIEIADDFLKYVRNEGLILRIELNDSPWSNKQKIVYLPMGVHVRQRNVLWIRNLLNNFLNEETS